MGAGGGDGGAGFVWRFNPWTARRWAGRGSGSPRPPTSSPVRCRGLISPRLAVTADLVSPACLSLISCPSHLLITSLSPHIPRLLHCLVAQARDPLWRIQLGAWTSWGHLDGPSEAQSHAGVYDAHTNTHTHTHAHTSSRPQPQTKTLRNLPLQLTYEPPGFV